MTPDEKLDSGSWCFRNSAWILLPAVSVGMLTWVAFLYAGLRGKSRKWLLYATIWLLVYAAYFALSPIAHAGAASDAFLNVLNGFLDTVPALSWIGGTVHVAVNNDAWLRSLAHGSDGWVWKVPPRVVVPPSTAPLVGPDATQIDAALRGTIVAPASPAAVVPVTRLDLNLATAEELQAALSLDLAWGEWLVATRARLGRFTSVDQLLTEGQVPPHLYLPARDTFTVQPPVGKRVARVRRHLDL